MTCGNEVTSPGSETCRQRPTRRRRFFFSSFYYYYYYFPYVLNGRRINNQPREPHVSSPFDSIIRTLITILSLSLKEKGQEMMAFSFAIYTRIERGMLADWMSWICLYFHY